MHDDMGPTVPPHMEEARHGRVLTIVDPPEWMGPHRLTSTMEPATGRHVARIVEMAAAGTSKRTDRAARRGLRGRGQR